MAKLSAVVKNEKRKKLAQRQAPLRAKLRAMTLDENLSDEERDAAQLKLQRLNRNGSKTRIRNRCAITGRPRGTYRKFNLCRIKLRELASDGLIPGVTKASW